MWPKVPPFLATKGRCAPYALCLKYAPAPEDPNECRAGESGELPRCGPRWYRGERVRRGRARLAASSDQADSSAPTVHRTPGRRLFVSEHACLECEEQPRTAWRQAGLDPRRKRRSCGVQPADSFWWRWSSHGPFPDHRERPALPCRTDRPNRAARRPGGDVPPRSAETAATCHDRKGWVGERRSVGRPSSCESTSAADRGASQLFS